MTARNSEKSLIPRQVSQPSLKSCGGQVISFSPEHPWSLDFHYVSKPREFVKFRGVSQGI